MQPGMITFARTDANVCGKRWVKLAPKSPVLFWIRDKGGETHLIRVSVVPQIYLVIQRKWLSGGWVYAIQGVAFAL